ncbi:Petrobactin biosynthesis protein AsbE [Paenibacillus sambharensis]|uniref:Petrobactin biosynthesis protein AsbE n=1 Tax=Paenibacillus sambharensis TaxID=1803190 RepID=A0A2W1L911_9BACL|nr:DUF6005 family protein [Paenibacillus sambharensis]PZD95403.1 Petrobactin biosynthesis protein AsbE [Paenibacillus sambharensis]
MRFGWKDIRINVHCLVSCYCDIVKRRSGVDYRPFYFNVWDAAFDVTEEGNLTYYANPASLDFYHLWVEKLFGLCPVDWYAALHSPEAGAERLSELLEERPDYRFVMPHLDMFYLPDRDTRFDLKPFPHYVFVELVSDDSGQLLMYDPDFRWEGLVPRNQVMGAFINNPDPGGWYIDAETVKEPSPTLIKAYFDAGFNRDANELTDRLREIVTAADRNGSASSLTAAVKHLKVIVIRKYSYDYALMYFHDHLELPAEHYEQWAQTIRDLVQLFTSVQFLCVKMAMTGQSALLAQILAKLDEADRTERLLKLEIERLMQEWCVKYGVQPEAAAGSL